MRPQEFRTVMHSLATTLAGLISLVTLALVAVCADSARGAEPADRDRPSSFARWSGPMAPNLPLPSFDGLLVLPFTVSAAREPVCGNEGAEASCEEALEQPPIHAGPGVVPIVPAAAAIGIFGALLGAGRLLARPGVPR
jgi:hypothetical protein